MTNLILAGQQPGADWGFFIMIGAMFVIMYFFMIRPQQKRQKAIRNFQNSLSKGSKVVTGGGIYGTVHHIDIEKNTVDVEIARGVVITVDKGFVFADTASLSNNR